VGWQGATLARMNFFERAQHFNRTCPKGTAVEITLRNGTTLHTKTKTAAYCWGDWALVEVEDAAGCYQVEFVRVLAEAGTDKM